MSLIKPHDIFPMQWVINDVLTSRYYETLTEVEVYRASKENFLALLKKDTDVLFSITSSILLRVHTLSECREAIMLGNAAAKVADILLFLAGHFGTKMENNMYIDIVFTHRDIASLLGLTRETVSLEIEKLEKEKIIEQKKHKIIIRNIPALKELSSVD